MGYLETGMRVLDSASSLLSRLQELAVLGANNTNTDQDHEAINLEAEALAEEFNRLMTTSTYKGKDVFVTNAASEYVGLGGRGAEMTFGIGDITYTELYSSTARTIVSGPNASATTFNIAHLPSDSVVAKAYGAAASTVGDGGTLASGKSYIVRDVVTTTEVDLSDGVEAGTDKIGDAIAANTAIVYDAADDPYTARARTESFGNGDKIVTTGSSGSAAITAITADTGSGKTTTATFAEIRTDDNKFVRGETYVIYSLGTNGSAVTGDTDGTHIKAAASGSLSSVSALTVGMEFTIDSDATDAEMDRVNALVKGMTFTKASDTLTKDIEAVQAKINTARVQAGSQYAALESAVAYTTDLTAQYELGYNTVNDVNFSMETAHLAKNQILQQAATAMLAQANQGQQSLLQLIQG